MGRVALRMGGRVGRGYFLSLRHALRVWWILVLFVVVLVVESEMDLEMQRK